MISLQEGTYPFPPFSFTTTLRSTSPLFYVPTILLLFTVIVGSCRYYTTKSIPWDNNYTAVSPDRKLGPLSKLIIVLSCLVTITFLADTVVIVTRAFLNSGFSLALCYYTGISWLAWATGIFFLMNETYKFSQWHWLQYTFYGMVVVGESLVGWLWLMGVKYPVPGKTELLVSNSKYIYVRYFFIFLFCNLLDIFFM
jgi:ATP-binding cassette subfamily B (MDR/TAP) protein 6